MASASSASGACAALAAAAARPAAARPAPRAAAGPSRWGLRRVPLATARRRPVIFLFSGAAALLAVGLGLCGLAAGLSGTGSGLAAFVAGDRGAALRGRGRQASRQASRRAPARPPAARPAAPPRPGGRDGWAQADDGWLMMPLGIPKVAYRLPGTPNADWVDIYNRLYRERIIFLGKEIDDRLANEVIGVLLYLDSEDNTKPISLYINSVGGSVLAGLAIYDTLQHIKSPVVTINLGIAASMASFLLAAGEKGMRIALPHSRVMIHQAAGGAQGQVEDIKVEAQQILQIHENIVRMYARITGQPEDVIRKDLMRDNFMSAEQAKEYGLIDKVIEFSDIRDLPGRTAAAGGGGMEAPKGDEAAPVREPTTTPRSPEDNEAPDVKGV